MTPSSDYFAGLQAVPGLDAWTDDASERSITNEAVGHTKPSGSCLGGFMLHVLRSRFWIESILALITGIVAVVTLFWHDWIETIFGVDPDKGNGSAEWLVVVILVIATLTLTFGACFEWRRALLAQR